MEITDSARNRMFSNKDLVRLIIPLIIEQMLTVTVGLADSIMTANVGEEAVKSSLCNIDRIKYHRSYDLTTDHSGISFITRNSSDHKKNLIISYFMLCNDLAASIHDPEHIKSRK